MSGAFLDHDYLLTTDTARRLFHDTASTVPIVDVHNHLSPTEIADDHRWPHLTDLWLGHDHYKWRAMRLAGHDEAVITGDADPQDRFRAWAATVPRLIGNPLYVWTHLELQRGFGIDTPLSPATADEIWERANDQLRSLTAREMLRQFDVDWLATTDDPSSPLTDHARHAQGGATPRMAPTLRPDAAHALIDDPAAWTEWADALGAVEDIEVEDLDTLLAALTTAHARFGAAGCRASDHGLARVPDTPPDPAAADAGVRAVRSGVPATPAQQDAVLLEVLAVIGRLAYEDDSVLQLHLGPLRNASPRILDEVGRDAGSDVMNDHRQAPGLARFLGMLDEERRLPRVVLYNLNPADNSLLATLAGAFSRPGVASLVQWGPPWWFNDHEHGMRSQLDLLAEIHQLSGFIGMLTDSRSILSMTRHELFRRVLCQKLGEEVERGAYPPDMEVLSSMVADVCGGNARRFFGVDAVG